METIFKGKIRLLLVDDEQGFRTAMGKRLAKRGLKPMQASSGEECLKVLEKESMDVIVLDVKMPGLSGIETLKLIRQSFKNTQVILLTGNIAVSDGIEGIKSGAFDYLTKPVEIDHLVYKIQQAFEIIQLEKEKQKELEYSARLEKKMIDTERLASLGTMSTGIAHEINNPLAIINESAGFMKQLVSAPEMSTFAQKDSLMMALEKIETSIKRARQITHQLLGHVKKPESKFSEINLEILLNETLGMLKKEIQDKQIVVNWEIDKNNNIIWSNQYQIRQVLINLLNNALHALHQNGAITLSIHAADDDIILEIKDNGVGIPKEDLGRIFDPFFTTKSFDEGTGLGLFVVHKIISGLHGKINVTSTMGKGTCFQIRLPK
jgi:two-component system, NtrC family, sensor kinase